MEHRKPIWWILVAVFGFAGTALLIVLILRHGVRDIAGAIAAARWKLTVVLAFYAVPLLLDAIAWRALFPKEHRLPLRTLWWMRWIGDSINALLPVSQVGGDIVRARLAALRGAPVPIAAATVIVGITLNVFTQTIFTLIGLTLLAIAVGRSHLLVPALLGTLLAVGSVAGFYAVQRWGIFRLLTSLVGRLTRAQSWQSLVDQGQVLDDEIRALYARRRAILISGAWSFMSWSSGACEVWIALWALGLHATLAHAWILESVGQGIRAVMFLVPGALGVHEAGYVGVGKLLSIPGNSALALALIRRVRELVFGIPGLIAWQWVEGRRLWRRERVSVVVQETQTETVTTRSVEVSES
jgi:putative membrane protein